MGKETAARITNLDKLTKSMTLAFDARRNLAAVQSDPLVSDAIASFQETAADLAVLPPK